MIRVFTSSKRGSFAGEELTREFEAWLASFNPNAIKIESIHTNSNKDGWMLTILYSIVINTYQQL
jgi:Holliday junction resolvasome RuvABC endonuclease subunit